MEEGFGADSKVCSVKPESITSQSVLVSEVLEPASEEAVSVPEPSSVSPSGFPGCYGFAMYIKKKKKKSSVLLYLGCM